MDIAIEDIGGSAPEPMGGVAVLLHYANHSDFTTIQDVPAFEAVGNFATKATIVGDHVFKDGKGFQTIKVVTETGNIKTTGIGPKKGRLFQNELGFEIAGSDAKTLGFMRMIKNGDFIVLVEEFGSGNVRQLGSKKLPAEFTTTDHATEAAVEGKNAGTFIVMDKNRCPAPIYTGVVTIAP